MTEYRADRDAEALIIYDFGEYDFDRFLSESSLMLRKRRQIKLKILTQAGINYATFEIPLQQGQQSWERFQINRAVVHNQVGNQTQRVELDQSRIYEERVGNNIVVKKFTMPNVQAGSIIELDYTIITPFFFNLTWQFQRGIPVIYSRLTYLATPLYEYAFILRGTNRFDEQSSRILPTVHNFRGFQYQEVEFIFGMRNIPAFRDEEFITTPRDHMISLNFQISKMRHTNGRVREFMTTWPKLNRDLLRYERFGRYIRNSERQAKKILQTLPLSGKTPLEQVEEITNYVRSMYTWNGSTGIHATKPIRAFMREKTGNAANLNLFLIGFLQAANFDVSPVILSTRGSGAVSRFHPFETFFNYVIAMVTIDGETLFLDATEPLLPFARLPERCINVEGLVVDQRGERWIRTQQADFAMQQWDFQITPLPEENWSFVEIINQTSGSFAHLNRRIYAEGRDRFLAHLNRSFNINPQNVTINNQNEPKRPFVFSFEDHINLESHDGRLYITPFCNLSISSNPFRQTTRTLPVDLLFPRGFVYNATIAIPEGYKVNFLPSEARIDNPSILFEYAVQTTDSIITISARYNLRKDIFPANEYSRLKDGMNTIIRKLSEVVILERK
jgi:hypothetical protein